MTLPDKYVDLVSILIERTENGDVEWRETSTSNQYAVYLRSGNLTVDYYPESGRPDRQSSPEGYGLTIFNDEGDEVDEIKMYRPQDDEHFDLLKNLYNSAKRSYLKVDETIEGMLSEVSEEDKVGGHAPDNAEPFEPDDELPF